jgi:tetratricopeptide (TPR) repeat protein
MVGSTGKKEKRTKRNKWEIISGLAVVVIIASLIVGFTQYRKYRARTDLAIQIADLGAAGGPPQGIEPLRKAIALYEAQIDKYVKDAAQTGVYWKILATRLQDKGLHTEALEALEHAISYTPEDQGLHYRRGLSAAVVAKSLYDINDRAEQGRYFGLAEEAYLMAIALDPDYARPRYALGVLYVFDLKRPEEAIPHVERYLGLSKNDIDGILLLAGAYYMTERYEEALSLCDKALGLTKNANKRAEVEQFKARVLESIYG